MTSMHSRNIPRDWRAKRPFVRGGIAFDIFAIMRSLALCLALLLIGGCCCAQKKPAATQPVVVVYQDRPAAALALVPPIAMDLQPSAMLDRSLRSPRAFVGYEHGTTEFYWMRTDDRVRFNTFGGRSTGGWGDRFERRAVSTRLGVLTR